MLEAENRILYVHGNIMNNVGTESYIKYRIYRDNGYSRLYAVECYGMEMAKMVM